MYKPKRITNIYVFQKSNLTSVNEN